ncbi:hypothetical protein HPB50_027135 [Hyalomma asiaticum]|uniref:Uncharacterized protein n=1 Tax=Hyalomma asiaticum TaxID=266040 RepID=A0ACB7T6W8_HYAAI|nr:hypothetical protein HPB50_027135 [Hyalomma asiaticum]
MQQKPDEYDPRTVDVIGCATSVLECEVRVRRHQGQRRGTCLGELWSSSDSSKPRDENSNVAPSGTAGDATSFVGQLRAPVSSSPCADSAEGQVWEFLEPQGTHP